MVLTNTGSIVTDPSSGEAIRVIPRRRVGLWLSALAGIVFIAWIVFQIFTNPGFEWDVVGQYMFDRQVLGGVWMTIQLTIACQLLGIILGLVLAAMRLSSNPVLVTLSSLYTWFFRATPALVQLIFWYNIAALFPVISLGIPFGGPKLLAWDANIVVTPLLAVIVGMGLHEAANMAEIIRAGILSVDPGQKEAARALGYGPTRTLLKIILPNAMKAIIPPTGNNTIGMLKYTSLAIVVSMEELTTVVQSIYSRTFQTIPLLIVASLWYLIMTTVLSIAQAQIERHYQAVRTPPWWQKLLVWARARFGEPRPPRSPLDTAAIPTIAEEKR